MFSTIVPVQRIASNPVITANYFTQDVPCRVEVVKTLLAASNIGFWELSSRERALEFAEKLVEGDHQFLQFKADIAIDRAF